MRAAIDSWAEQEKRGDSRNGAQIDRACSEIKRVLQVDNSTTTGMKARLSRFATELDLSGKHLTSIPDELGQARTMSKLVLSGNQLNSLPAGIGRAKALAMLDLEGNRLTDVPAEIRHLICLRHLNLRGNQFSRVPRVLLDLPVDVEIDLQRNPLPDEEITAMRELIDRRRGAGQTMPQFILPPLAAEAGELREAAANEMNVHTQILTDAFKKRLDEVIAQMPYALRGTIDEQRTQLKQIEERLEKALNAHESEWLTQKVPALQTETLRQARAAASQMFEKGQGEKEAYYNDFHYSAGHVLAYTFLAMEAQWHNTPDAHQAEARHGGITRLIGALSSGSGMCDTRLCEEVMQTIGLPLSNYAQAHLEVVSITAPPPAASENRDIVLAAAKQALATVKVEQEERGFGSDSSRLREIWCDKLMETIRRDHPNLPVEDVNKQVADIQAAWQDFCDVVEEERKRRFSAQ